MTERLGFVLCDDGVNIQFGLPLSNGHAFQSGVPNDASRDMERMHGAPLRFNSPYPTVITTANAIVHEYNVVRDEMGYDRMPPWPRSAVQGLLESEARQMRNPLMQREVLELLGRGSPPAARPSLASTFASGASWHKGVTLVRHPVASLRVARNRLGLEAASCRVTTFWTSSLSLLFGRRLPSVLGWAARRWPVTFSSLDEAIDSLEDTIPATRNATPPAGAEEILFTRPG